MKWLTFFASALGIFLISCTTTSVVPIGDQTYVSRHRPSEIEIYFDEPKRSYVQVAFVEVEGASLSSSSKAIEDIKKKAAQLGGDAVILRETKREMDYNALTGLSTKKMTRAIIIRYQ